MYIVVAYYKFITRSSFKKGYYIREIRVTLWFNFNMSYNMS